MISVLKGTIEHIGKSSVVIMTPSGVGYEVSIQVGKLASWQVGDEIALFTYLKVSDQAMDLYGFENTDEKVFFELLLTVSGVGPKAAMRVLSLGSVDQIQSAIARGDAQYLTAVQGMGKKTAERLCVELKNKVNVSSGSAGSNGSSEVLGEVVDGLVALGYSKEQARETVEGIDAADMSTEEVLKIALQQVK